jgi:DNA repair protein RecO (recombination protein O)
MPQSNIHSTRGIVLHHFKYSESSIIAKIYTESFGIQSYIVRGVRKKGARIKAGLFQPLSLVELVVYYKEKNNIQNLKEIKSALPFTSIPFDINKSTIALFINEILYKCLKEEEANQATFKFLFDAIKFLDKETQRYSDFHLLFMIKLTKYLGFFPKQNYSSENTIFDLSEGIFVKTTPQHMHFIDNPLSKTMDSFLSIGFKDLQNTRIQIQNRRILLDKFIDYYRLHIEGFDNLKSYPVLKTVFSST